MAMRIVRLGSDRVEGEGLRIGTVRRPPRGVPKADFGPKNWYDVWLPNLSPSAESVKLGKRARTDREWRVFEKRFRAEMNTPENIRLLELLAALSHQTNFSVGCYCQDEARCHRSVLRALLLSKGAEII
jgi:uncharacterized protein YeaO (DUF488 family)